MPELPEVETIKIQLKKFLVGHIVKKIQVNFRKPLKAGEEVLVGAKITGVDRFGKMLCLIFNNGSRVYFHLKLTGQLIYRGPNLKPVPDLSKKALGGVPGKHTHVIFYLDRGGILYFNDYRKFGWIRIVDSSKKKVDSNWIKTLGLEPLKDLTENNFKKILAKTAKPIKVFLMDQTKIAGIGNIYANDALNSAKIRPDRKSNSLTLDESTKLFNSIEKVLKTAIDMGGSSDAAYVTPEGGEGNYQNHFLTYMRAGQPCKNCGEKIIKIKLGGRGTYYCPKCQK